MSNVFTEAISNCKPIPSDEGTSETIKFFTDFIEEYGSILKEKQTLSFKFLITHNGSNVFHVILRPSNSEYGCFSAEHFSLKYGPKALINLLKNNGAQVIKQASDYDEIFDHYLVKFTIPE